MASPWDSKREKDLRREIRDHLDLEAEAREETGVSPEDAQRAARLAFGNPDSVREDVHEAWGWAWLERLVIDVRHAIRLWRRNPGFSAIAVATVAIGIGASTAIFSQINAVFWTPLPVERPDELRLLAWTSPRHPFIYGPNVLAGPSIAGAGETFGSFSYLSYVAMRDGTDAFSDLACWADLGEARPVVLGERGFGAVQFVSGNYFRTLGVSAALGRTIHPDDDRPGAAASVVMLSHRFWHRAFGGDPGVTQQTIKLNGQTFGIVGVLPERFFGMDAAVTPDVVVPVNAVQIAAATVNPLENRGIWAVCRVVGRLRAGVSEERARVDVEQWVRADLAAFPPEQPYDPPHIWLADGSRGLGTLRDAASTPLVVLLAVVGVLMLASCANIAGLLLARGNARQKEIVTRLALGAPRSRVVRQLITESLVLSAAGGALGLVLAYVVSGLGPSLLSGFMPTLFGADRALTVGPSIDVRVLAFSIGAALVSGLIFGVVPAFRATHVDLISTIRQTAAGRATRSVFLSGGQAMVAAQTALAVLLLVSAGLLLRTVVNLRASDLGFKAEGLLYARVEPRSGALPREQRARFFEDAVRRVERLPGVVAASGTTSAPISGDDRASISMGAAMPVCTSDDVAKSLAPRATSFSFVLPRFFATIGVPVVAGRDFTWSENDTVSRIRSAVVNQSFAQTLFPGQDAIGQSFFTNFGPRCTSPSANAPLTIVGVVADSRTGLRGDAQPTLYAPLRDSGGAPVTLVLRIAGDAAAMIPVVRNAVKEVNASIPTFSEATLVDLRERSLRRERLLSDLLTMFGVVTVIVCCLGIYGTLAYSVARRRSEISVRMAIGATARDVILMFIRESLLPVTVGIAVGCGATLALTRWLESLLFGVSGHDPLTIVAAAALFLLVATIAAAIPARAAARVDPVLALRQ